MRALAVLVLVSGCYGAIAQDGDNTGAPAGGSDDPVVDATPGHQMDGLDLELVQRAAGTTTRFTKIDNAAYTSAIGAFTIDVSISDDARDYRAIHPDGPDTNVTFPEGTMIIRKVFDATGAVSKITLMAKGPTGYAPTIGDWWFGVTDANGVAMADANGGFQVGKLTECYGCHIPHANNDFLFGVPTANQAPDTGGGGGGGGRN